MRAQGVALLPRHGSTLLQQVAEPRDAAMSAITRKVLKMHEFVFSLQAARGPVPDASLLVNTNTPEEWECR